jgi:hypothetical protein
MIVQYDKPQRERCTKKSTPLQNSHLFIELEFQESISRSLKIDLTLEATSIIKYNTGMD